MDWNKTRKRLLFNKKVRRTFVVPKLKKSFEKAQIGTPTVLCDNCTAGMILHDFGVQFNSPTVNLYFDGTDFYDFAENLEFYIDRPVVQIENTNTDSNGTDYPMGKIEGDETHKDIVIHFLHYHSFEEASSAWNRRKERMDRDNIFLMMTFLYEGRNEEKYRRAQALPYKNKVIFVNHPSDPKEFPSFFYIRGFECIEGLGQLGFFMDPFTRYYDQFDSVHWLKTGEIRPSKRERRCRKNSNRR